VRNLTKKNKFVGITIPESSLEKLDRMCEEQMRNRSNMVAMLINTCHNTKRDLEVAYQAIEKLKEENKILKERSD
jgi:metal-responsive CopG/Arc/MetJ family transcriptional regulator